MSLPHATNCPACNGGDPLVHVETLTADFKLTPSRTELVVGYIQKWQSRLGLDEWIIRYNPNGGTDKGGVAQNSRDSYRRLCEIRVSPDCPDGELENSVIHELLHLVVAPVLDAANRFAGAVGGKKTGPALMDAIHDDSERMIEQIAFAMSGRRQTEIWWSKKQLAMFQAPKS